MSIVAVHGPNTMFTTEGGGTSIPSTGGGIAQATKSPTNGLVFSFSVPNPGARPAADFDWTFTGPGSPAAQPDKFSGTVTFTGAGAVTIICTVAAGAGPPAGGTYTVTAAATAGTPRSAKAQALAQAPSEEDDGLTGYDPGEFTVADVEEYVAAHPDELQAIYDAEIEGKNRTTLVAHLESLFPFDPAEYTIEDVKEYVSENPDEAQTVLDLEREGKDRSTLVTFLEDFLADE